MAESKKRQLYLRIVKYVVYTIMIGVTTLIITPLANTHDLYIQLIWTGLTDMMALVLVMSMQRISFYRRKLFDETI